MSKKIISFCALVAIIGCDQKPEQAPADLILWHGKIVTMDASVPEAEALAVVGNKIVAVGTDAEIQPYVGSDSRIIDLKGMLAIPGLIEGHGHYMSLGESLMELELRHTRTWQEIVKLVESAVDKAEPGDWIIGRGWHQNKWVRPPTPAVEGLPVHQELSKVSTENPVLLIHTSGHGVFVNALALELAGISKNTPNPSGGEIVRDSQGNATGMLREAAQDTVRAVMARHRSQRLPEVIEAERRRQVQLAGENALANGITSFQDMGSTFETIDLLKKMAEEGNLSVRLYIAIEEPSAKMVDRLESYRTVGYCNGFLTVRTIGENVLDGALGTHGGWLLEPYSDMPRTSGLIVTPIEEIRRYAELAVKHDYQLAIQGIGDRAARTLFDIYEETFKNNPQKQDWRWRIEHAQVIHPDDLPRFAELGVIAGIQGIFACSDGPWVIDRLGEQRARERGYIFRSMIESRAITMNGTDPPVEDIDPLASIHCAITRKLPDGSLFFPEQSMTREQALRSYTINNAYAAFEEKIKGSLTPGKLADITVLSKDIMAIPEDEILNTEIIYTIVGGVLKYEKALEKG
ncbi:MAG: amidohydrolase [bacterium]